MVINDIHIYGNVYLIVELLTLYTMNDDLFLMNIYYVSMEDFIDSLNHYISF